MPDYFDNREIVLQLNIRRASYHVLLQDFIFPDIEDPVFVFVRMCEAINKKANAFASQFIL